MADSLDWVGAADMGSWYLAAADMGSCNWVAAAAVDLAVFVLVLVSYNQLFGLIVFA